MTQPALYSIERENLIIKTFGSAVPFDPAFKDQSKTILALETLTASLPYTTGIWQRLPSERNPEGRREVLMIGNGRPNEAEKKVYQYGARYDGLILNAPGRMGLMITSDCPVVAGYDFTGKAPPFMIHCGRDSLHNTKGGKPRESVLFRALELWQERGGCLRNLHGYIFMGIAPKHFNNERYPNIVETFRNEWGYWAAPDRVHVDLVYIIRQQLEAAGVPNPEHTFAHDGLDTYSDPRLASLRAGKREKQNVIAVAYT